MLGEIAISDWGASNVLGGASFSEQLPIDSTAPYRQILFVILIANLWTLVLTTVPVIANLGPNDYYAHHPNWYAGNDVMRFIEPIGGTILQFFVLFQSGIFKENMNTSSMICVGVFMFGLALYGQGAGFHSSSNMFKNALETIITNDDDNSDLHDLWFYMRVIWEHAISHYLYAIGYAIMNLCQFFAYRHIKAPYLGLTKAGKGLLISASIIYALLIAGVAIEFPSGTIVALIYLLVVGVCVVGGFIVMEHRNGDKDIAVHFGMRPIVHHFALSYVIALIIVVVWMCLYGIKDRSQSGV